MLVKLIVVLLLLVTIGSLFSALYFLIKDKGQSNRIVNALTLRISLSVIAFLVMMTAYYFGLINPNASPYLAQ